MGIKGIYLKIIKAIHDRPTSNIFNDEKLEPVPLRLGTRIPTLSLLFNIMLKVLAKAFSHGKKKNTWHPNLEGISKIVTAVKSLQSCPTLCNPIDNSPSGSPVPGILQARTLEWVAISFSNA